MVEGGECIVFRERPAGYCLGVRETGHARRDTGERGGTRETGHRRSGRREVKGEN